MNKYEIVDNLARGRVVETIASNMIHEGVDDLQDLCQIIYLSLLKKPDAIIVDLWETGSMNFYIVNMIRNQVYGYENNEYARLFRQWRQRKVSLCRFEGTPIEDEGREVQRYTEGLLTRPDDF